MKITTESTNTKPNGEMTARIADKLSDYWKKPDYYVLYDHDPSGGKIVSFFEQETSNRNTQLSHIDIAIVKKSSEGTDRVFALIEIEETTDKPKVLLGDVFGVLMGEYISTRNGNIRVDKHTILVILAKSKVVHKKRNKYLLDKVMTVKPYLASPNSEIETVFIKTFHKEERVVRMLTSVLGRAFGCDLSMKQKHL